jgi:hypothetical protein
MDIYSPNEKKSHVSTDDARDGKVKVTNLA